MENARLANASARGLNRHMTRFSLRGTFETIVARRARIRSAVLIGGGAYVGAAMAFATQLLLARGLSLEEFGEFSAALASVNILMPLAAFGLTGLLLRSFGEERAAAQRWVGPALLAAASTTVLVLAAWFGWGVAQGMSLAVVAGLCFYLLGQTAIEFHITTSQLTDHHGRVALLQFSPPFLRAVVLLTVILLPFALGEGAAAMAFGLVGLIHTVAAISAVRRLAAPCGLHDGGARASLSGPVPRVREVIAASAPYGVMGVLYMLYSQVPIVMANEVLGAEAAALYNMTFILVSAACLLPSVVSQKFFLKNIHAWLHDDKPRLLRLYRLGLPLLFAGGVAALLVLGPLARLIFSHLFGIDVSRNLTAVIILLCSLPFRFLSIGLGALLVGRAGIGPQIRCLILASVCNICLGYLLGTAFGLIGIASAMVITELVLLAAYWLAVKRWVISA